MNARKQALAQNKFSLASTANILSRVGVTNADDNQEQAGHEARDGAKNEQRDEREDAEYLHCTKTGSLAVTGVAVPLGAPTSPRPPSVRTATPQQRLARTSLQCIFAVEWRPKRICFELEWLRHCERSECLLQIARGVGCACRD